MRQLILGSLLLLNSIFSLPISVEASEEDFTWQPWRQRGDYPVRYDSGFSNLQLGGYMDFEAYCKERGATEFWYRLSDFVLQLGTGSVQSRCKKDGSFLRNANDDGYVDWVSPAVLLEQPNPGCLIVKADVGDGLILREQPTVTSKRLDVIPNGQSIFHLSPSAIRMDSTQRQWIKVSKTKLHSVIGWVSIAQMPGEHQNLALCPTQLSTHIAP
ncbi:SH3 domain-containing protein [Acaryochloris marina NIES-2412]|uniref:SH3 domain-containing protein n=1 Tax=Acaryochloris marina TaxID=155978 RepID=UPI00405A0BA5